MRIVIKVGTSTLSHGTGKMNIKRMELLCKVLSDIKNMGHEIILVSSGAIGMGVGKLMLNGRPSDTAGKQAAAAVGQCELMYTYDKLFSEYRHTVAQLLLSNDDFKIESRHENLTNTIRKILELNVIPIINENDSVATEEIEIGDNDTLSALVASSVNADLLVLLSDIDGLYTADPTKDPDATLIKEVKVIDEYIISLGKGSGTALGTGGMQTKIKAAIHATSHGCNMIIANGKAPEILYDIIEGKKIGTVFSSGT